MYRERAIIPITLRKLVMDIIHSARQGVSGMEARARSLVFWPGITADTYHTRAECSLCNRNAPSHAPMPATDQLVPSTAFEAVFGDSWSPLSH